MIFVSIGLLVVAAIALGIGITSSSVPPLVVSILATLAAAGTLWASFVHYRQAAAGQGRAVTGLGGNQPRTPGYPEVYTHQGNGHGAPGVPASAPAVAAAEGAARPVPEDWDDLDDARAVALVSAFNLEELHALRRHEVEHRRRAPVVAEIDQRIDTIVDLRRRATSS
ncbi:MAG TPA: hypothetical protein VFU14_12990 [Acidimicrobiales bacterium]|nr:hypothetical protein [Acidimicrobiales bacterium]